MTTAAGAIVSTTLPARSRLTSLADELILRIVECIDDVDSLRNAALTCSFLNNLIEPYIYQSILIRSSKDAENLLNSLRARPRRMASIRTLSVRYGKGTDPEDGIAVLNAELPGFHNLRRWTVESPCINDTHWRSDGAVFHCHGKIDYVSLFDSASMTRPLQERKFQQLQSFTLHSHIKGESIFTLEEGAVVFHHPTLRNLHLSCFDVVETEKYTPPDFPLFSTGLESLTFEECNIDAAALKSILSLPKALKRLTVGERLYHFRRSPCVPLCRKANEFLQGLKQQSRSLEYLKHTGLGLSNFRAPHRYDIDREHFRALSQLAELDVRNDSVLLHSYLGLSKRQFDADPPVAPPLLRTLRIHDVDESYLDDCPRLLGRDPHYWRCVPSPRAPLRLFELVLRAKPHSEAEILGDLWDQLERRARVFEFARAMGEVGTRVVIRAVKSEGFIPPYMYGETLPCQLVAYDSDKATKFGAVDDKDVERRAEAIHLRFL